jgi:hypothetical protein
VAAGICDASLLEDPQCNYGKGDKLTHPINCVTWLQADRYCKAQGKRLPTEEEWEYAARAGAEGRAYSWGNDPPDTQVCWSGRQMRYETCPVASFARGAFGLVDVMGNVWEWTSSHMSKDYRTERTGESFVTRGGAWNSTQVANLKATYRTDGRPTDRYDFLGFRCARALSASSPGLVISFIVTDSAGRLQIGEWTEFRAEELGDRSTWNGVGTPRYRWRLMDDAGRTLDAGDIAYQSISHTPLEPGRAPVHLQQAPVFVVRAPAPTSGQAIEISSLSGSAPPVLWRREKSGSAPNTR